MNGKDAAQKARVLIRECYIRWVRPHLSFGKQQRATLLWSMWGYWPIMTIPTLSLAQRLHLLFRLLRVDWNVTHAHWPGEVAHLLRVIAERPAQPGEVVVEAGCWKGGSTAKFSIVCHMLGYRLRVYDSFEGVEPLPDNPYAGQYAATEELVREHVSTYGEIDVCDFVAGWFADTLAKRPVPHTVRGVYIDCDLAKATKEVLQGVLPSLAKDGAICSQDYHIDPVRAVLDDESTWRELQQPVPAVTTRYRKSVILRFDDTNGRRQTA